MRQHIVAIWNRLQQYRRLRAIHRLLLLAFVFLAVSFVIHLPQVQNFDLNTTLAIQSIRDPILDRIFAGLSFLGNTAPLIVQAAIAMAFLIWRKHPHAGYLVAVTVLGVPLNMLLKEISRRPRPGTDVVEVLQQTIGMSFPSGHAMASTMFYGFLAFLAWVHVTKPSTRLAMVIGFSSLPLLVSLSRIYMGAHWLSDVFGGMTAGLFFLVLIALWYKKWTTEATTVAEAKTAAIEAGHSPITGRSIKV